MRKRMNYLLCACLAVSLLAGCGGPDSVVKKIDSLGEITLGSGDAIEAAEKAFAELKDEDKSKITNYDVLVGARDSYEKLLYAKDVVEQFNAEAEHLAEEITISDLYAVQYLRSTYDSLPDSIKAECKGVEKLEAAEKTLVGIYADLMERAADLTEKAAADTSLEVKNFVDGRRELTEAMVLMDELKQFGMGISDEKANELGLRSHEEIAQELDTLYDEMMNTVCYPGTGIVKLDYIVGKDFSKEKDPTGDERLEEDGYYYYTYMLDGYYYGIGTYHSECIEKYNAYLAEHFKFEGKENVDGEKDHYLYKYVDDQGHFIHVETNVFDGRGTALDGVWAGFITVQIDKEIIDGRTHDYQGESELKGKPVKYAKVGDEVVLGSYEQNNVLTSKEPISWIVLDEDEDGFLLISKEVLDGKYFHESVEEVTWETSDIRKWLNEEFYTNAFAEEEKGIVRTSTVNADENPSYATNQGGDTEDKVFLLSAAQMLQYYPEPGSRPVNATEYAKAARVEISQKNGCASTLTRTMGGNGTFCVVSAGNSGYLMGIGNLEGNLTNGQTGLPVKQYRYGIRPAIWVSVDKMKTMDGYSAGVSAEGSTSGDALAALSEIAQTVGK